MKLFVNKCFLATALVAFLCSCSSTNINKLIREMNSFEYGSSDLGTPNPVHEQCEGIITIERNNSTILPKILDSTKNEKVRGYAIYCMRMAGAYDYSELVSKIYAENKNEHLGNPSFDMNFMMNQAYIYLEEADAISTKK